MLGQLDFVNGGYAMSDEATPNYQDILLNLQKGHQFLFDEFNFVPRAALSVGSSGHPQAYARILAEGGFNSLYILNVNKEEREYREDNKQM